MYRTRGDVVGRDFTGEVHSPHNLSTKVIAAIGIVTNPREAFPEFGSIIYIFVHGHTVVGLTDVDVILVFDLTAYVRFCMS